MGNTNSTFVSQILAASKNTANNTLKFVPGVFNYGKNVTKSLANAYVEVFKSSLPSVFGFIESNSGTISSAIDVIKNPLGALNDKLEKNTGQRVDFKAEVDRFKKNFFEDLKTGNFYDEKRRLGSGDDGFGDFDLGDDSFGGFDFDDGWGDADISDDAEATMSNDKQIARAQERSADDRARTTIKAMGEVGSGIIASNTALASSAMKMDAAMHNQLMGGLDKLTATNAANIQAMTAHFTSLNAIIEASTNKLHGKLTDIENILKRAYPDRTTKTKSKLDPWGVGGLNLEDYFKKVMKNLDDKSPIGIGSISGLMGMASPQDMLAMLSQNPLGFIVKMFASATIGSTVKGSMERFDKTFSNFFKLMNQRLLTMGKKDGERNIWTSIFGVEPEGRKTFDLTAYKRGIYEPKTLTEGLLVKITKATTEVIPTYLRDIAAALTGNDRVYDYNSGKFVSPQKAKRDLDRNLDIGTYNTEAYRHIDASAMFASARDRKEYQREMREYLNKAAMSGERWQDFNGKTPSGVSSKNWLMFQNYIMGLSKEERMKLALSMIDARESFSNSIDYTSKSLVESGLAVLYGDYGEIGGERGKAARLKELAQLAKEEKDPALPEEKGKKIEIGKGAVEKVKGWLGKIRKLPMTIVENTFNKLDNVLHNMIFGFDDKLKPGEKGMGLIEKISNTISDQWKKLTHWLDTKLFGKEGVFTKMKNKLIDDKIKPWMKDKFGKLKKWAIGEKGEGGKFRGIINGTKGAMGFATDKSIRSQIWEGLKYSAGWGWEAASDAEFDDPAITSEFTPVEMATYKFSRGLGKMLRGFQGFMFGSNSKGMIGVDEAGNPTPSKKMWEAVKADLKGFLPKGIAGGLGGLGVYTGAGLLTGLWLPGGPLFAGLIGAGASLIKNSQAVNKFLFGEEVEEKDADGNVTKVKKAGLLSEDAKTMLTKTLPKAGIGFVSGSVVGNLLGGPIMGNLFGVWGGMIASSKKVKELIFGNAEDETSGLFSKKTRKGIIEGLGFGGASALAYSTLANSGIMGLSLLPGGPLATALVGIGAGLNADSIKAYLFGKKDKNGKLIEGQEGIFHSVFSKVRDKVVTPIGKGLNFIAEKGKNWFQNNIVKALTDNLSPIKETLTNMKDRVKFFLLDMFRGLANMGKHAGMWIARMLLGENMTGKLFRFLAKGLGGGLLGLGARAITAPFRMVGKFARMENYYTNVAGRLDRRRESEKARLIAKNRSDMFDAVQEGKIWKLYDKEGNEINTEDLNSQGYYDPNAEGRNKRIARAMAKKAGVEFDPTADAYNPNKMDSRFRVSGELPEELKEAAEAAKAVDAAVQTAQNTGETNKLLNDLIEAVRNPRGRRGRGKKGSSDGGKGNNKKVFSNTIENMDQGEDPSEAMRNVSEDDLSDPEQMETRQYAASVQMSQSLHEIKEGINGNEKKDKPSLFDKLLGGLGNLIGGGLTSLLNMIGIPAAGGLVGAGLGLAGKALKGIGNFVWRGVTGAPGIGRYLGPIAGAGVQFATGHNDLGVQLLAKSGMRFARNFTLNAAGTAASVATQAAGAAATSASGAAAKAVPWIKKVFDFIGKGLAKVPWGKSIISKMGNVASAVSSYVAKNAAKIGIPKILASVSRAIPFINLGFTVYNLLTGYGEAAQFFKVGPNDVSFGMKLAAAVGKAAAYWIVIVPPDLLTQIIYRVVGGEKESQKVAEAQERFRAEYAAYQKQGGTLTEDQYNKKVKNEGFFSKAFNFLTFGAFRSKEEKEAKEFAAQYKADGITTSLAQGGTGGSNFLAAIVEYLGKITALLGGGGGAGAFGSGLRSPSYRGGTIDPNSWEYNLYKTSSTISTMTLPIGANSKYIENKANESISYIDSKLSPTYQAAVSVSDAYANNKAAPEHFYGYFEQFGYTPEYTSAGISNQDYNLMCGPIVAAIIIKAYTGTDITPLDVFKMIQGIDKNRKSNPYFKIAGGKSSGLSTTFFGDPLWERKYGIKINAKLNPKIGDVWTDYNMIIHSVINKMPVIVLLRRNSTTAAGDSVFGTGAHYMLITSASKDGKLYVQDPFNRLSGWYTYPQIFDVRANELLWIGYTYAAKGGLSSNGITGNFGIDAQVGEKLVIKEGKKAPGIFDMVNSIFGTLGQAFSKMWGGGKDQKEEIDRAASFTLNSGTTGIEDKKDYASMYDKNHNSSTPVVGQSRYRDGLRANSMLAGASEDMDRWMIENGYDTRGNKRGQLLERGEGLRGISKGNSRVMGKTSYTTNTTSGYESMSKFIGGSSLRKMKEISREADKMSEVLGTLRVDNPAFALMANLLLEQVNATKTLVKITEEQHRERQRRYKEKSPGGGNLVQENKRIQEGLESLNNRDMSSVFGVGF